MAACTSLNAPARRLDALARGVEPGRGATADRVRAAAVAGR
jgi:hypothetical protein